MTTTPSAIVELSGLERSFHDGRTQRQVLSGVDLVVRPKELVAIIGASGSGKTTLLNVVGALDGQFSGEASLYGRSLRGLDDDGRTRLRHELVGFVFQSFHLLEHLSVLENVKVPLWLDGSLSTEDEERRSLEALEQVGLRDRASDPIGPLSGGERQRVAIARALANHPPLILADEPTGNLDTESGKKIYALFDDIRNREDRDAAVVVVTHDDRLADRADRVLRLIDGRIEEVSRA